MSTPRTTPSSAPTNPSYSSTTPTSFPASTTSLIPSPTCTVAYPTTVPNATVANLTGQVCFVNLLPSQLDISPCCINTDVREWDCQSVCVESTNLTGLAGEQAASDQMTSCLQGLLKGTNATAVDAASSCFEYRDGVEVGQMNGTTTKGGGANSVRVGAGDGVGLGVLLVLLAWGVGLL